MDEWVDLRWELDDGGDWQLYRNDDYFGMVCPHNERFVCPVAIWDDWRQGAGSVDEAKVILRNWALYDDPWDERTIPSEETC